MWKTIECAPQDGKPFLAAVEVSSKETSSHWEYTIMYWDEGRLNFYDPYGDTGWMCSDYTHCMEIGHPLTMIEPKSARNTNQQ